jgi:tellurite methyltransferase
VTNELSQQFGDIDIYLFDQILRGRIGPDATVLDAGCGRGRNLVYLLRRGQAVQAADADPASVAAVRSMARALAPALPADNFRIEPVEAMSFPEGRSDVVISSAVLHFAHDHQHFEAMLRGTWRPLAPGGLFFCRLASSIGLDRHVEPIGGGRFLLPDGSERYLVNEAQLLALTRELGGTLLDPLKTTIVQNQRCMTTWVVRKAPSSR